MHATQSSVGFTTALARLVLLQRYGADAAEQRDALRSLVLASQDSAVELEPADGELLANGRALPLRQDAVEPLIERLGAHHIRRLVVRRGAMAGELVDLARILAAEPEADGQSARVGLWNVQILRAGDGDGGPRDAQALELSRALEDGSGDAAAQVAEIETFVLAADEAGRSEALVEPLLALDRCASARGSSGRAMICRQALDRLSTPSVMRQFAQALPLRSDRAPLLLVLKRAGDVGAHAIIAHLMASETIEVRRVYFDAIVALRAGVPRLMDALGHQQWYIVRNAAALLGEMRIGEADEALIPLLDHPHVRVREAAATALNRLGTELARKVLAESGPKAMVTTVSFEEPSAPSARTLETEPDEDVRLGIVAALGRLATPAAVQRLIRVFSNSAGDKTTELRIAALEALAAARGGASVPLLRELTRDDTPDVRDAARRLIAGVAVQ